MEAERQGAERWMATLPGGADGVIRIADLLGDGADPERMLPQYTIDGIHWTPAGVAVVVQLLGQTLDAVLASQAPSALPLSVSESLQPLAVQTDQKRRLPA